jgi:hypothetical protein
MPTDVATEETWKDTEDDTVLDRSTGIYLEAVRTTSLGWMQEFSAFLLQPAQAKSTLL